MGRFFYGAGVGDILTRTQFCDHLSADEFFMGDILM